MPKHAKKRKNSSKRSEIEKRPIPTTSPGQEYCVVSKVLGSRRFTVRFPDDGGDKLGVLAGRVKKRSSTWVSVGTWVIASVRDYQTSKCDIFEVLGKDEVTRLERMGELSSSLANGIGNNLVEEEPDNVIFEEAGDSDDCAFAIDDI